MKSSILTTCAAMLLCGSATFAQPAPGPNGAPPPPEKMSQAEMAKHHAEMCKGFLAEETGKLATLEVRLDLTSAQKPLFAKWKSVKLGQAEAQVEKCIADKPPMPPKKDAKDKPAKPMPLDPVKMMQGEAEHLQMRLTAIKTELPAFKALVASLSDDQKHALMPPPRHHGKMGPKGPQGGPQMGKGPHPDQPMGGPDGHGHDGPDHDGPPPAP